MLVKPGMSALVNKTDRCMYRQWYYDYNAFGKALKLARVAKDLRQDDVAKQCGCSRSTYWKMEHGGYCDIQIMARVSALLDVDMLSFNRPPQCDTSAD